MALSFSSLDGEAKIEPSFLKTLLSDEIGRRTGFINARPGG